MRRGWLALLMMVLVANGFVPCAALSHCYAKVDQHACCAPTLAMQAGCCASLQGTKAIAPEAASQVVNPAARFIQAEIAASFVDVRIVAVDIAKPPPGLHAPPIVFRI
jgi:hypothetical protein